MPSPGRTPMSYTVLIWVRKKAPQYGALAPAGQGRGAPDALSDAPARGRPRRRRGDRWLTFLGRHGEVVRSLRGSIGGTKHGPRARIGRPRRDRHGHRPLDVAVARRARRAA